MLFIPFFFRFIWPIQSLNSNTMRNLITILLIAISFSKMSAQNESIWLQNLLNPKKCNGVVLLDADENTKVWQCIIYKRNYNNNSFSDEVVHRESFTGINAYYIPNMYREDSFTHEYFYQIFGYNETGSQTFDSGKQSIEGDGTPHTLVQTWTCSGFDYAYKIELYTLPGYTSGILQVTGPGYVYDYIEPENTPCGSNFDAAQNAYFNQVHGLTPGWCVDMQNGPYNFSAFIIQNDFSSYFNKYGLPITSSEIYAVQKTNWKWPSGSISVENIGDASGIALWTLDDVIQYINLYSNIAEVSEEFPTLECISYSPIPADQLTDYNMDPESIAECVQNGIQDNNVDYLSDSESVLSIFEILNECHEDIDLIALNGLEIVNLNDPNKPISVISLGKNDFINQDGDFTIPSFTLDKGVYWIFAKFQNGKTTQFYKVVNHRNENILTDSMLVDLTVFPVPIIGDSYKINIVSQTNTSIFYEVYNNLGNPIYKTQLKVSSNDNFNLPVDISGGIPNGNIFHKFIFEDGSITTINTIK